MRRTSIADHRGPGILQAAPPAEARPAEADDVERLLGSVTLLSDALHELAGDFARLLELLDDLSAAHEATRDVLVDLDRRVSALAGRDGVAPRPDAGAQADGVAPRPGGIG